MSRGTKKDDTPCGLLDPTLPGGHITLDLGAVHLHALLLAVRNRRLPEAGILAREQGDSHAVATLWTVERGRRRFCSLSDERDVAVVGVAEETHG